MIEQWEVMFLNIPHFRSELRYDVPLGWEPFAAVFATAGDGIWIRRRRDASPVSHGRGRVLSAVEVAARQRELTK